MITVFMKGTINEIIYNCKGYMQEIKPVDYREILKNAYIFSREMIGCNRVRK
jgi:hypothetical protein